jgi:hypothetical protein
MASAHHLPTLDCRAHCAPRLVAVAVVVELVLAEIGSELDEAPRDLIGLHIPQPQRTDAGRVGNVAVLEWQHLDRHRRVATFAGYRADGLHFQAKPAVHRVQQ